MDIRAVRLDDPEVAPLVEGLTEEYEARYGETLEMAMATAEEFVPPAGIFLALFNDGTVVAGGGFRPVSSGVCEVKRMWTAPDQRGQGRASAILDALENAALSVGYTTVRLETGPAQPEAAALYLARGYEPIPRYGIYPDALAFERHLDPPE